MKRRAGRQDVDIIAASREGRVGFPPLPADNTEPSALTISCDSGSLQPPGFVAKVKISSLRSRAATCPVVWELATADTNFASDGNNIEAHRVRAGGVIFREGERADSFSFSKQLRARSSRQQSDSRSHG